MSRARLLLLNENGDISDEFDLNSPNVVIGRAPEAHVVIQSEDISRAHAQIVQTPQGFFVTDMGSTNGTFLNGAAIKAQQLFQLQSNDQVNLGNISLMFQVVPDTFPSPPPLSQEQGQKIQAELPPQLADSRESPFDQPLPTNTQPSPVPYPTSELMSTETTNYVPSPIDTPSLFEQNLSPTSQQQTSPQNNQPTYLPPTPSQAIDFPPQNTSPASSLSDEDLKLAEEIFGSTSNSSNKAESKQVQWASWDKMNFLKKKVDNVQGKSSVANPLQDVSEEDLFNQIMGGSAPSPSSSIFNPEEFNNPPATVNNQAPENSTQSEQVLQSNFPVPASEFSQAQNLLNSIPQNNIPSPVPAEKLVPNDQAAYYYPQASNQTNNPFPLDYSFDENKQEKTEDPFEALKYQDNDSILSKFMPNENEPSIPVSEDELRNKLKVHHHEEKPDLMQIVKKQALPIGLIVGAIVLAIFMYYQNSGAFG